MHKRFIQLATLFSALAVALGAFAVHGLKQILSTDILQVFETAVRYQFYHALALLAAGILFSQFSGRLTKWAGYLFITGIILFSGSLYFLCYAKHVNNLSLLWVGAITPLGGICFITGWLFLFATALKKN